MSWATIALRSANRRRFRWFLEQIQAGKFDVHLYHRALEPSVNRLVLGMLASALFMGSSWTLSNRVPPLLFPDNTYLGFHQRRYCPPCAQYSDQRHRILSGGCLGKR